MEFFPACHIIPGLSANAYLLIDPKGLAIIDCGLPGSANKIQAYIESIGHTIDEVRWIFITHADDDHYGGLHALQQMAHTETWASREEAEAIRKGNASRPLKFNPLVQALFNTMIMPLVRAKAAVVDGLLTDGQTFPIAGGMNVIATPGHTPGHISFFLEKHGILFSGDSLRSLEGRLVCSVGVNTWDEWAAAQSMEKQARLLPDIVCCGHGPILNNFPMKASSK